jgi:hypothetical protein
LSEELEITHGLFQYMAIRCTVVAIYCKLSKLKTTEIKFVLLSATFRDLPQMSVRLKDLLQTFIRDYETGTVGSLKLIRILQVSQDPKSSEESSIVLTWSR